VRAERLLYDSIHDQPGNQCTVGIALNYHFIDDFFYHDNHLPGCERDLLLHAQQTPQLCVALLVCTLGMDEDDIRINRRNDRYFLLTIGAFDKMNARIGHGEIAANIAA
jgi:hypothetical protein